MAGPYTHTRWRLAVLLGALVIGVAAALVLTRVAGAPQPPPASPQARAPQAQSQPPRLAARGTPLTAGLAGAFAMMGGLVVIAAIRCRPGTG